MIIYDFVSDFDIKIRCYIQVINFVIFCKVQKVYVYNVLQAHGDLVSAVDFNDEFLMTGYEDANVGVWSMTTGQQVHNMLGHNGGVTGIQIQLNLAASSSYDSTVITTRRSILGSVYPIKHELERESLKI